MNADRLARSDGSMRVEGVNDPAIALGFRYAIATHSHLCDLRSRQPENYQWVRSFRSPRCSRPIRTKHHCSTPPNAPSWPPCDAGCWATGPAKIQCRACSNDLGIAGARDAAFPLNSFMAIVADTARLAIPIHRPQCLDCSESEQLLLFAASLAQAGQIAVTERVLRRVSLADAGAKRAPEPLRECTDLFAAAGLRFTRRRSPAYRLSPSDGVEYPAPPAP